MGLCESTSGPINAKVVDSSGSFTKRSLSEPSSTTKPFHNSNSTTSSDGFTIAKKLILTTEQKVLIQKYWESVITTQRKDIFHKTMLASIEASPKMNEIIACGRYCYRDLTKWPKLNRICQAQFNFFNRLIVEIQLDEGEVMKESYRLGKLHATYAQYGLKPHFLDIYQLHLLRLIKNLKIENDEEKQELVTGWTILMDYIIECINLSYMQALVEGKSGGSVKNVPIIEEL